MTSTKTSYDQLQEARDKGAQAAEIFAQQLYTMRAAVLANIQGPAATALLGKLNKKEQKVLDALLAAGIDQFITHLLLALSYGSKVSLDAKHSARLLLQLEILATNSNGVLNSIPINRGLGFFAGNQEQWSKKYGRSSKSKAPRPTKTPRKR